jgi:hydrogenase maturation protease
VKGGVLVAGIGNIFLGDDGFGVEVVRRMEDEKFPDDVRVADFGIRGVHLAYELLEGYDSLVLVDATSQDGAPGTIYVIEPTIDEAATHGPSTQAIAGGEAPVMDSHSMDPGAVFSLLRAMGGRVPRLVVVGCEPSSVEEGIGLSPQVESAIDRAAAIVREVIERERSSYAGSS